MIRAISLVLLGAVSFAVVYWVTGGERSVEPPAIAGRAAEDAATNQLVPEPTDQPATVGSLAPQRIEAAAPAPMPLQDDPGQDATLALRGGAEMQVAPPSPPVVRNVTPDDMTAPPPVSGPLERVALAEPKPAPAAKPARLERLFNPVVTAAGAIKAGDREIQLAGIAVTEPDRLCGDGSAAWPCGRMARAALRSFIRGRAVECEIPAGAESIPASAKCQVGGDDIAAWLVGQGWAERSGDKYADAAGAAKEMKLGLYGKTRPDAQLATR